MKIYKKIILTASLILLFLLIFVAVTWGGQFVNELKEWKRITQTYFELKLMEDEGQNDGFINLSSKTILAVGDSQTSMNKWQYYLGHLTGANIRTHAKGGAGMIAMVDGRKDFPKDVDPKNYGGVFDIPPLSSSEIKGVDFVIVMGLYNEMYAFEYNYGKRDDIYPSDTTYCGLFNHLIYRIREELNKSGNTKCQIILAGAHQFGKYPYSNKDCYYYKGLSDSLRVLCKRNDILYCDLMKRAGIDSTNWSIYQSHKYINEQELKQYGAKFPQNRDDLHLNKRGQLKVAVAIAKYLGEVVESE